MPSLRALTLTAALACPLPLAAQTVLVGRLGNDTLSVEKVSYGSGHFQTDLVLRSPSTRLIHYTATLGANGQISRVEGVMRDMAGDPAGRPFSLTLTSDSAVTQLGAGDSTRRVAVAVERTPVPLLDVSAYALVAPYLAKARKAGTDSLPIDLVFPGSPRPMQSWIVRRGGDTLQLALFGLPVYAAVDAQGHLLWVDATHTTDKVRVTRGSVGDIGALAKRFAAQDKAGKALGQLSPRDTARATIAGADLLVDYGRPSMRGRKIFGGIVPLDSVWRTGANAATQFSTSKTLVVGSDTIPAGKYTLWTVPTANGATLIVNSETGQWGTDYDAAKDLLHLPLQQNGVPQPVERFTIGLTPKGTHEGVLTLTWDTTRWSLPFAVVGP